MTNNTEKKEAATLNVQELENYILDVIGQSEVPGLSIAIVKGGETLLAKGYGTREVGKDWAVDEHTLFAISGATASFTASALAILVGEGKMDWDDRIVDLLPGFKTGNDLVSNHATVIDALTNRTGLPMEPLSFFPHPDLSRADILSRMQHVSSNNNFRSSWGTNFHMNLAAGEIIPAVTGISWDDFVKTRLFDPMGMEDSITGPHRLDKNSNIATPHEKEEGKVIPVAHARSSNVGPATSIYASAVDMAKWLTFQLNNGKVGEEVIVSENEINRMRTGYISANFDFPGLSKHFLLQGLGLLISDGSAGHKIYSNGGDTEGTESCYAFVPELDLGIAVMVNSTKIIPQPLVAWIIDRYAGEPIKDWVPAFASNREAFLLGLEDSRKEITDPAKKPSCSLDSYEGLYQHPLWGDLTVQSVSGKLSFNLGTAYEGDLLHANHDTFFIHVIKPHLGKVLFRGPAQFRLDPAGQVSSLLVMDREFQKTT